VVVLDNAPFHRSRGFRERRERWRGRGLEVVYLPSPSLGIRNRFFSTNATYE